MLSAFHPNQLKTGAVWGPRHGVEWGRLGWNGVETGGGGVGAKISGDRRDRVIGKQGFTRAYHDESRFSGIGKIKTYR